MDWIGLDWVGLGFDVRSPISNSRTWKVGDLENGRRFTGYALDQAQNRGLTSSVIEDAIRNGRKSSDPTPGRTRNYSAENNLTVITEGNDVIPGKR